MKTGAKHIIKNAVILFLLTSSAAFFFGCGGEADTVNPAAVSVSVPGSLTGTVYPQIISVYPDGSVNPQIDTQIVIVFSKPIALGTVAANISIIPATPYTESLASGGYAVVLQPSASLSYSTTYNVNILTGIQDSVDGYNLSAGGTFSFTTAASTAAAQQPRVIAATRYPASGATGVSKIQPYVEVTFTESVINVTTGTFTISGGTIASLSTAVVAGTNNKTWRLNLDTATIDYGQTYTVALTAAIQTAGGATLVLDGNHTWPFQIEPDPASAPYLINDIWVDSVTDDTAVIKYTTSKPYLSTNAYIVYDNDMSGFPYANNQSEGGAVTTTLHTVTLSGLNPGTIYYFRGWLSTEAVFSGEFSFRTANDATVNSVLTNAANNQNGLVLLQTNGTGSYAFWVSNQAGNLDIYGQYFSSADGSIQWGAGGTAISSYANSQNGIVAITDGFADAVIIYNDSNSLYSKTVNAAGLKAAWGATADQDTDRGLDLVLTIKAGSSYSACIVHERPDIICSGVATMPDNGAALNLLYDANVDFSALPFSTWLDMNDLFLIDPASSAWNNYAIDNQFASPVDIFPYVIKSSAGTPGLSSISDYYIADADVTITGAADSLTTTTQLRSSVTNLLTVVVGDIIQTSDGQWGLASGNGAWSGTYFFVDIDRTLNLLADGDNFTIYTNHAGPFNSEAVTNPLWDISAVFNPGVTVLAGDFVVNEHTNLVAATSGTVSAITAADTDYALQLTALINPLMANGDIYSIVRLPSTATGVAVGFSTNPLPGTDFYLRDTWGPFTVASTITAGDIVFNIDQNLSAMVVSRIDDQNITLTADIFNNTLEKAIVYRKRGFLVTFVDASDYIVARAFNIATGASLGAAFNVCTAGTNSKPVAVSDGAGNAIIFYEKSNLVYVKKVSAKGGFVWSDPLADQDSDAGIQVTTVAGYTIVQALPDRATGSTGGAYLLVSNSSGSFQLWHVNGATGAAASVSVVLSGYDPQMVVDYDSGAYNRVIIVYRAPHTVGVTTYYHISAVAYRRGAGILWAAINVSSNTDPWNCYQPSITLADNTNAADAFYISWFDGRYFNPCGYSIYAQRYTSAPAAQWAVGGAYISMPTSMGYDHALDMKLLYWNDTATAPLSPYGILPVWLDYRTNTVTGTDIYYQKIDHSLTFIP